MKITFDPPKRDTAYEERGLRFEDAEVVFAGLVHTFEDIRRDYGESRFNDREQKIYGPILRRQTSDE